MLPYLPSEILDLVTDNLSDEPSTLKACCLVSKSWVPRTRRHLFASVLLDSDPNESTTTLDRWVETFPDPSNSPARYTRNLIIYGLDAVTAATNRAHAWVRSFNCIEKLVVDTSLWDDVDVSLVRLHGFSPTLKSLCVDRSSIPLSEVINLACSFPLLEDLAFRSSPPTVPSRDPESTPLTSPKFTGFLLLKGKMAPMIRRLLALPGGLHFSQITMGCVNFESMASLISGCSHTLESFSLDCGLSGLSRSALGTRQYLNTYYYSCL
jgi:hypothetical protein